MVVRIPVPHNTQKLFIDGKYVDVDEKLVDLIWELNLAGIKTVYCCQGDDDIKPDTISYIQIDMNSVQDVNI